MDEVQKKVSRITDIIPNCLSNRRILQSGLSDILADDRLHINLLMAAYDENIVGKLNGEKDSTIAANYLVRQLHNSYGFHNSLCVWTVVTWLFILKRDDEAILLFNKQTFESERNHSQEQSRQNPKQEQLISFCTNCGNRFIGQEIFCGRCGKRRLASEAPSSTVAQTTSTNDTVDDETEYYCTRCGAVLNLQQGFSPNLKLWVCKKCGEYLFDDDVYLGERFKDIFWFCDNCRAPLNIQDGFRDTYDYWKCTECSYVNRIAESEIDKPSKKARVENNKENIDAVLVSLETYRKTGDFPNEEFVSTHWEIIERISRSNYPQKYGALLVLGECYLDGYLVNADTQKAKKLFLESLKGQVAITESEIELFNIFYRNERNFRKAHYYCELAMNHGDPTGFVYMAREFLLDEFIDTRDEELLQRAFSVCMKGAMLVLIPPYRDKFNFLSSRYICAVMGKIIAMVIWDEKQYKTSQPLFDDLISKLKKQIYTECQCNVLYYWWFEDTIMALLTEVFELTDQQQNSIDLTDEQRAKLKT